MFIILSIWREYKQKMEVIMRDRDILIVPETDFEEEWLRSFKIGEVFHKCGISPAEYVGIMIKDGVDNE